MDNGDNAKSRTGSKHVEESVKTDEHETSAENNEDSLKLGVKFFEGMSHLKKFAGHTQLRRPKPPIFMNKFLNIRDPLDPLNNLGKEPLLTHFGRA